MNVEKKPKRKLPLTAAGHGRGCGCGCLSSISLDFALRFTVLSRPRRNRRFARIDFHGEACCLTRSIEAAGVDACDFNKKQLMKIIIKKR